MFQSFLEEDEEDYYFFNREELTDADYLQFLDIILNNYDSIFEDEINDDTTNINADSTDDEDGDYS